MLRGGVSSEGFQKVSSYVVFKVLASFPAADSGPAREDVGAPRMCGEVPSLSGLHRNRERNAVLLPIRSRAFWGPFRPDLWPVTLGDPFFRRRPLQSCPTRHSQGLPLSFRGGGVLAPGARLAGAGACGPLRATLRGALWDICGISASVLQVALGGSPMGGGRSWPGISLGPTEEGVISRGIFFQLEGPEFRTQSERLPPRCRPARGSTHESHS